MFFTGISVFSMTLQYKDIMKFIISRSNEKIVAVSKLKEKKQRDSDKLYIAEGIKLFKEAIMFNAPIKEVYVLEKLYSSLPEFKSKNFDFEVNIVNESVLDKLSTEKAPEGIITVINYSNELHRSTNDGIDDIKNGSIFILCSVRDPGNVGTVIRSCSAFGIDTLILSRDCADIYNSKTVRASMGAVFRQKIRFSEDLISDINKLRKENFKIYAAALDTKSISVQDISINNKTCFIVGNEGNGIPEEICDACDCSAIIPMEQGTESLNASIAASVLIWEQYRRGL